MSEPASSEPRPADEEGSAVPPGGPGPASAEPEPEPEATHAREPVLPRSPDESDVGWGDRPADDDDRLRREVPPHWGED